ncbi:hypothetical protein BUALT_Bualt09G0110000 [Buddleja alternifolia]|uniref:Uncharacterized protein n=1 Tax=Buddleja alternifolia TaxID=168488 RepID=A0AAV6X9R5_9LAMI|nr:hypothetical protein BUALT_Bualt09G0110000 [Buddleja alternifolia]
MLGRWIMDPRASAGLPVDIAALVVGVAAFLVALPRVTHLMTQRIAFGQIVLVCVDAVISSDDTTLEAFASVVALLLPFPGLAYHKVQTLCRVYAENAFERMNIYLKALNTKDRHTRSLLVSQAKPIAETGTKLLHNIIILRGKLL